MIKVQTKLNVIDNSGAKLAKCIKILGKGKKKTASVGSLVFVTLSKFVYRKRVVKRTIYLGLITGIKYWVTRLEGTSIKFFSNRILIFNKQYKFLGTRIYGAIGKEIKTKTFREKNNKKNFQKVIAYSPLVI